MLFFFHTKVLYDLYFSGNTKSISNCMMHIILMLLVYNMCKISINYLYKI